MKLTVALLLLLIPSPFFKPAKFCTPPDPNQPNKEGCICLVQHAKSEYCTNPAAPLPSCCWATEKKRGLKGCACCRAVYGSTRDIILSVVGSYFHQPESAVVEYDISSHNHASENQK